VLDAYEADAERKMSPDFAAILFRVAQVEIRVNSQWASANKHIQAAWAIRQATLKDADSKYSSAQAHVNLLIGIQQFEAAKPIAKEMLTVASLTKKALLNKREAWLLNTQLSTAMGNGIEAESYARLFYDDVKQAGDKYFQSLGASALGKALKMQKRYADAEPILIEAFELLRQHAETAIGKEAAKARTASARDEIVTNFTAQGKTAEAEEWKKKPLGKDD
jgi:hypothetical protein